VFGTSHVLVVDEVLSNNELKPEKPYGDQAALNVLSCVVIAFGNSCQEIMDAQSQLLIYGVLPEHKIMVAERKKVSRLVSTPAHPRVSLSRPTATGGNWECAHKTIPQKK